MSIIIGIDIGTSGTKAIAFTSEGAVIANTYVSYNPVNNPPGYHELDPEVLFNAVITTIERTAQQATRLARTITGISFSTAMHSLIAVDKSGRPLTHVITWADARSAAYADALKQSPVGSDIYRHTGTPVHPMSPLCKLMWLRDQQPEIFAAAHKFISIKEFIFYRFFNQYLVDHSIASATGLFDIDKKTWYAPALAAAGITSDHLSQPVPATHVVTGLNTTYAKLLGITGDMPFVIGASDGCLANLGSNATQPGDLSVTIGTSGAVRMIATRPAYDLQERIFNYILTDELYVSGGAINNGVVLLKWYAEHFLQKPFTSAGDLTWFVEQAAQAPAGADGLLFLPYLLGERAPVWDAAAKGVFFGVHAGHTQAHFMRAIIEGINYALYQVAASVQEAVGQWQHIYASGGFINSPLWLQWLTDVFGKEIKVINSEDASAVGAALLGGQALGLFTDHKSTDFFHIQQQYTPDAALHTLYQRYYNIYAGLYSKLKDDFQTLRRLSAER
ncbi:gluconate kinase [Niastella caeni]|uniref:Gluconate kinase n=1 Tax=Niastella caeni TaxID=2569763 RepID=A0A4S8HWE8_9BACT|nr:gluconokinase [Niastella caeni]THU40013.1 gluconate kinase [Niastella caeni]